MKYLANLLFLLVILSCNTVASPTKEVLDQRELLRNKRTYIFDTWAPADSVFDVYYGDFIKNIPGANYYPIWFNSLEEKIDGIIFTPLGKSRGTVLLIHGYAGNIRDFRLLAPELLRNNYTVATLSLPGHGLSDGKRGDINNFNDYGILVNDFVEILKDLDLNPEYAVGNSTGCSSLMIYNENYGWGFKKVAFISPLIKPTHRIKSMILRFLTRPIVQNFNTNDKGLLEVHVFPMNWFDQLVKWNRDVKKYSIKDNEVLLFQGEKDGIIQWGNNIKIIKKLYPNTNIVMYENGTHTVLTAEKDGIDITKRIVKYLQ